MTMQTVGKWRAHFTSTWALALRDAE